MKVALVHDWLIHMRGGEKVLDAIAELYPEATIYTLFSDKRKLSARLQRHRIKNSFLQYFPGIKHYYRWLLPILPFAIRSLQIEEADLVISSSHCVAKGIRIPANARHLCYCHTPMRYLWGFQEVYFSRYLPLVRLLIRALLEPLKAWDLGTNAKVDLFIANSEYIRVRIKDVYRRDAVVVHPPMDTAFFKPGGTLSKKSSGTEAKVSDKEALLRHNAPDESAHAVRRRCRPEQQGVTQGEWAGKDVRPLDYFLAVSHFVPYKRLDVVIEAFNALDRKLVVIGSGPLESQYKKLRTSGQIFFWGGVSDQELRDAYAGARALIFPTEEDFGIVPLEAQSCGTPVIAYRKGGALETVQSGVFFDAQTPEAVREAVTRFEQEAYVPAEVSAKVQRFGRDPFLENMRAAIAHASASHEGP